MVFMKTYIVPETTVLSYMTNTTILTGSPALVAPELSSPADVDPGSGSDAV